MIIKIEFYNIFNRSFQTTQFFEAKQIREEDYQIVIELKNGEEEIINPDTVFSIKIKLE